MTVNTRLQENPALQRFPTTQQEWTHFINEFAKWTRYIVKLGDGTITTSGGTTISGLDEMPGTVASGASLTTLAAFNMNSTQSVIPLSGADVGSDTTITIASHNIIYDVGTVAYNSGTITGLAFATEFHVYADDPTKAGGAVTYVATTTITDLTSNIGRYFVGTVTTPADGAGGTTGSGGGGGGKNPDVS